MAASGNALWVVQRLAAAVTGNIVPQPAELAHRPVDDIACRGTWRMSGTWRLSGNWSFIEQVTSGSAG